MQEDRHHARVRQIPIRVESRQSKSSDQVYGGQNNHHCNDQRAFNVTSNDQGEIQDKQGYQKDNHRDSRNQHHWYNSSHSRNTLPNTSSIDIEYKPTAPQRQNEAGSLNLNYGYDARDIHGNSEEQHQKPKHQSQEWFEQNQRASLSVGQSNKENKNSQSKTDRSHSPRTCASNISDKLVNSPEPIPLPPPPELQPEEGQPKGTSEKQDQGSAHVFEDSKQNQDQQQNETVDSKRPKKDAGPLVVINSTRAEVLQLLKKVSEFNGTSLKAKDYLLLDELLTRCILRLDDIQCSDAPDLRQQRKSVIELIQKCLDILQRKVQLNVDIQQLMANCSQILI